MTDETALREAAEAAEEAILRHKDGRDPTFDCRALDDFLRACDPTEILSLIDTLATERAARERAEAGLAASKIDRDEESADGDEWFKRWLTEKRRAEAAEAALAAAQAERDDAKLGLAATVGQLAATVSALDEARAGWARAGRASEDAQAQAPEDYDWRPLPNKPPETPHD